MDRRSYLAIGVVGVVATATGCLGDDDTTEEDGSASDEVGDHMATANNYDGTIEDFTGAERVDIDILDGETAFDPAAIRIDTGTQVAWDWVPGHTVTHVNGDKFGSPVMDDERPDGSIYVQEFDEPGTILYECDVHSADGHRGVIIVEGEPVGQESDDDSAVGS